MPIPPPPPQQVASSRILAHSADIQSSANQKKDIGINDLSQKILDKLELNSVSDDYDLAFCDEEQLIRVLGLSLIEKVKVLKLRSQLQLLIISTPIQILPFAPSDGSSGHGVYSWGSDVYGRLGHGTEGQHLLTPGELKYFKGTELVGLECGAAHTVALSKDGHVWCWGKSHMNQVAVSDTLDESWVVSRLRAMECWPLPLLVQDLLPSLTLKISQVAAGYQHCLALSSDGKVFAWGSLVGCGLGKYSKGYHYRTPHPSPVKGAIEHLHIVYIAAGGKGNGGGHSLAVERQGNVYGWGVNDQGQLGLGHVSAVEWEPAHIPLSAQYLPVRAAAAGHGHSLLISQCCSVLRTGECYGGVVATAGQREDYSAKRGVEDDEQTYDIGISEPSENCTPADDEIMNSTTFIPIPTLLSLPSCPQIAAFARQSACVTEGRLYLWGDFQGRNPCHIALPGKVKFVSVGERHVLALLDDGSLWSWGEVGADSGGHVIGITGHGLESLKSVKQPKQVELDGIGYRVAASGNSSIVCLKKSSQIS